ncbi:DUF2177 family protein [Haliscomenobacter hydrossis]|uniref:Uncharacterized protein n=1 Tax=Haliscomenobacter hydrossis (strain ATCC 27775 / DSM 1100 / LMG 10767 / O) TaxID=760192 RepID=F4L0T8_HALH1|nr:DUF2177 family protein [Haliscomenobacter hydrossis]AEE50542.1 hypothetical protein Halhy_2674 [Haliscomenobacter hydrossis DSM 1100]
MKRLILSILPVFVLGMVLNGLFHGGLAASFFDSHLAPLGESMNKMADFNPIPIAILEIILVGLIYFFTTRDTRGRISPLRGIQTGALIELGSAAAWNLANQATFKGWSTPVTLVDISWHVISAALMGWVLVKLYNWQTNPAD